ncbi:HIRAN domain-containing protein [Kribbella sp. CA-247076]|uniref:HIRAN domain-containing protein n=1 Tax=Kribbella sp. CA-247076 TaxID=3239941 RepID=UPI003D8B3B47
MGLMDRLRSRAASREATRAQMVTAPRVHLLDGDDDLEVVGEINYQAALWAICGGRLGQRVRYPIGAVLVPEPHNIYDSNAIAVAVEGNVVGYLDRQTAALYVEGLHELMASSGAYIGLQGVIVGGGYYDDGPGRLGVWLEHDPRDFGVRRMSQGLGGRPLPGTGTMRTGFSEAWLTDAEDDSYDLSWFNELPEADRPAIAMLRGLLAADPDPIDRHFQFAELEARLYRCRDLYDSALDEFDDACRRHDAEMETICQAFMAKWSSVPLLETYRQMAIRQQKKKDWDACLWWAERGLALYGNAAARGDAVEDLLKRRNRARQKLEAAPAPKHRPPVQPPPEAASTPAAGVASTAHAPANVEILICGRCSADFERLRVRGRKPQLCPACRVVSE